MTEKTGWEDFIGPKPEGKRQDIPKGNIRPHEARIIDIPKKIALDKFGKCPSCKGDWDGGDIFESLCQREVLTLSNEAGRIAAMYGWTPENKKRFSNVVDHTIDNIGYYECSFCRHVFELGTNKEYRSMFDLKLSKIQGDNKLDEVDDNPFKD